MKLNREAMGTYLEVTQGIDGYFGVHTIPDDLTSLKFEIIGDNIEEMSNELNPDVEQTKTILGTTVTTDNGYEPSMDADPFYANPERKLYPIIKNIAMDRAKGDCCKTLQLEIIVEDDEATTYDAWLREVMVKPQSYGGGTEGLNFPFQTTEDGKSVRGKVTAASMKAGSPTFSLATTSATDP